jgi:hypothetical protein
MSGTATNCQVNINDQVPPANDKQDWQTVGNGVPVYATYIFTVTQGADPVKLNGLLHGLTFGPLTTLPLADTQGRNCYADPTDLSKMPGWGPGKYSFSAFNSDKEISQGLLEVLP